MSFVAAWALQGRSEQVSSDHLVRLVLPFRRELTLLASELHAYVESRRTWFQETFGFGLAIQIRWSAAGPNLIRLICGR